MVLVLRSSGAPSHFGSSRRNPAFETTMLQHANPHKTPGTKASVRERRAAVRHDCLRETTCQPLMAGKNECVPAIVRDLSAGGIRLHLRRWFEPGRIVEVPLANREDGSSRTLLARVVCLRARGGGNWSLGCAWLSPLLPDEVKALL